MYRRVASGGSPEPSLEDAMQYDGQENSGQITIEMLQKAYAQATFHGKPDQMYFYCKPEEYEKVKEALEKMFSE